MTMQFPIQSSPDTSHRVPWDSSNFNGSMDNITSDLPNETWKGYSKVFNFFGQPNDDPDLILIMIFLLGAALLIVSTLVFFTWRSFVETEGNKQEYYTHNHDFQETPVSSPSPASLYQSDPMDWSQSEDSQVAQDEIQRETNGISTMNGFIYPEYAASVQPSVTPPPAYDELDFPHEGIPPV